MRSPGARGDGEERRDMDAARRRAPTESIHKVQPAKISGPAFRLQASALSKWRVGLRA